MPVPACSWSGACRSTTQRNVSHPDEAFFAPLDDFDIGDTRVFLGIVHHADTIDEFRRRRDFARKHLREFGTGSVCGYGCVEPEQAKDILNLHAEDAREL